MQASIYLAATQPVGRCPTQDGGLDGLKGDRLLGQGIRGAGVLAGEGQFREAKQDHAARWVLAEGGPQLGLGLIGGVGHLDGGLDVKGLGVLGAKAQDPLRRSEIAIPHLGQTLRRQALQDDLPGQKGSQENEEAAPEPEPESGAACVVDLRVRGHLT